MSQEALPSCARLDSRGRLSLRGPWSGHARRLFLRGQW